jgi:hypothetical protein
MKTRVHVLSQEDVTRDDRFLRYGGPAGQTKLTREDAFIHLGVLGKSRLLRMLSYHSVERLHILKCSAHQRSIVNALAVITKHPDLCRRVRHRSNLSHALTCEAHRDSAHRTHVNKPGSLAQSPHLLDHTRCVSDGRRIRHRVHAGVAPQSRSARTRFHGLSIFTSGLTQVSMQVHEPGKGDEPFAADDIAAGGTHGRDVDNEPISNHQINGIFAIWARSAQDDGH